MSGTAQAVPVSNTALWTGRIIGGILILFLLFDSITKIMKAPFVLQAVAQSGYPVRLVPVIGWILLICIILYVIPRTSILGAILLTGYLGGAFEANLRASMPLSVAILPIIFGILAWFALYLRDRKLQELVPLRSK